MGIFNYVIEFINWETVNEFNEFKDSYPNALDQWLRLRYNPRYVIPLEHVTLFHDADQEYKAFCQLNKEGPSKYSNKLTYKEKKFIVERKDLLLDCYKYFSYYLNIYKTFESTNYASPLIVRYVAEKYLKIKLDDSQGETNLINDEKGICVTYPELHLNTEFVTTISSFKELSIDQKEIILSHSAEFHDIASIIQNHIIDCKQIKKQEIIHERFLQVVINHPRRSQYYISYLETVHAESEQFCLNHIDDLDSYIANKLEAKYNIIKRLYPEGIKQYDIDNEFPEGENLSGVDYWEDCVNKEDLIKKYHSIGLRYNELFEKYPNGIDGYKIAHKIFDDNLCVTIYPSKEEIINLGEEKLAYYEELSDKIQTYKEWELEQDNFSKKTRNVHDKYFNGWGCYYYKIPFEYKTFTKQSNKIHLKVWQHFINSYCIEEDLDYEFNKAQKNIYEVEIPQFKNRTLYFKEHVYDKILTYIYALKEEYGQLLVLFGDSGLNDTEFDKYHYNYIKQQLSNNHILFGSKLINPKYKLLYKNIVIIELITSNENLQKQCSDIFNTFNESSPNIIYITLVKEYDRQEMLEIIKSTHEKKVKEEEERQRKEKEEIAKKEAERLELLRVKNEKARLFGYVSNWYTPSRSSLKCFSMYYYYPTTCEFEADEDEWEVRNLIWNFKASPNKPMSETLIMTLHERAAQRVADDMEKCFNKFFGNDTKLLTLVCIPSSKKVITKRRYEDFSSLICDRLNMANAFQHVHVVRDGEAKHIGGSTMAQYDFDEDYFNGRYVILFDDVITSGSSMEQFRRKLERLGAIVIGGFSIGKTKHEWQESNPIEIIDNFTY